jgi:beta-N-acetylhexosaminidase
MASAIQNQPGQLLFCGFEGTTLPADLAALIAAGRVGGVILFSRNIVGLEQLRDLNVSIHEAAPALAPVLIGIDQEGGRVQRLREPWTLWPPMRRAGDLDDVVLTGKVASALARELLDVGIALDFAPCVDVDTNPDNPVIGDRSFSRDVARVAEHARHFVAAMQQAGVAACAKHFPGHGDTSSDSHFELPRLDHDIERLWEIELPPFRAAVEAGVASLMTAHVSFPALDGDRPATLSPPIMAICRDELSYDGVVFSDDLEMKAVADRYSPEQLVSGALESRVDAFLVCKDAALRDAVLAQLERESAEHLAEPLRRVALLKRHYAAAGRDALIGSAGADSPPYPEHQRLARQLRDPHD